jgi:hypothetical protein
MSETKTDTVVSKLITDLTTVLWELDAMALAQGDTVHFSHLRYRLRVLLAEWNRVQTDA